MEERSNEKGRWSDKKTLFKYVIIHQMSANLQIVRFLHNPSTFSYAIRQKSKEKILQTT